MMTNGLLEEVVVRFGGDFPLGLLLCFFSIIVKYNIKLLTPTLSPTDPIYGAEATDSYSFASPYQTLLEIYFFA